MKNKKLIIIISFCLILLLVYSFNRIYKSLSTKSFQNFINTKSYKLITVNHHKYPYLIHIPPQYKANKPIPLVIAFHGAGGNPKSVEEMTSLSQKADKEGFIVVYPGGTGFLSSNKMVLTWEISNKFQSPKDKNVQYINSLILKLQSEFNINSKKIYVTGFSNGAALAYNVGYELSDKIAAVGIVSGFFNPEKIIATKPIPIVIFHGTKDRNISYKGGSPKKLLDKLERKSDNSIRTIVNFWAENNKCNKTPIKFHKSDIVKESYTNCENNSDVILYTLINKGHAWPGGHKTLFGGDHPATNISATNILWDFFSKHSKK